MKTAVRMVYAPALFFGFLAAAVIAIDHGASLAVLPALLVTAIFVSWTAERYVPYQPAWNHSRGDTGRDVAHALVNELATAASVATIPFAAALRPWEGLWPHSWSLGAQLALAVVVADIGITLVHWASHRVGWLWRFHAVHHSVERMYGFNGLMRHPVHQAIETLAGTFPLMLIGLPLQIGALLGFAVAIQLLLQHSNVDMRLGPLRYVFAWAPVHRPHHVARAAEGNVSFGLFTTFVDRILGTTPSAHSPPVADGELGVEDRPDFPRGYVAHLVEPFVPVLRRKS